MDLSTPSASGWSSIAHTVAYNNFSDLPVVYNGSYYIMVTYRYPMGGCSSFPQYLGPSGGVVPQPLGRHVGL